MINCRHGEFPGWAIRAIVEREARVHQRKGFKGASQAPGSGEEVDGDKESLGEGTDSRGRGVEKGKEIRNL